MYKRQVPGQPTSLIAYQSPARGPFRAVIWSDPRKAWIYAPAIAAARLFDDQYQDSHDPVDRATAEQIARQHLGTELPGEEELERMCQEGQRLGQDWGPPRSNGSEPATK